MPGISQLLIELDSIYNMRSILSILLKQMIPLSIVVSDTESIGDEHSRYFTLLLELLQTVDLDSASVIRFVDVLSHDFTLWEMHPKCWTSLNPELEMNLWSWGHFLDHQWLSYVVMLIFQDGGHGLANLFPVSGLVTSDLLEGQNLLADQISSRWFHPLPRYFYFQFLKTNGHDTWILVLAYFVSCCCCSGSAVYNFRAVYLCAVQTCTLPADRSKIRAWR